MLIIFLAPVSKGTAFWAVSSPVLVEGFLTLLLKLHVATLSIHTNIILDQGCNLAKREELCLTVLFI